MSTEYVLLILIFNQIGLTFNPGSVIQGSVTFQKFQDFYLYLGEFGDYSVLTKLSTSSNATLYVAYIDQVPFTSVKPSSSTLDVGDVPLRPVNSAYTRIRVSWSNNAGLRVYDPSTIPSLSNDTSLLNQTVFFSLTSSVAYKTPGSGASFINMDYWEYVQIAFAAAGVFLITSITFAIRRYVEERRRRQFIIMRGGAPSVPVHRPIPIMHKFIAGVPNATINQSSTSVPFSKEEFKSSLAPDVNMTATTVLVLMPADHESYLSQGQLPPFSFGTNILGNGTETASRSKPLKGKGMRKIFEMIPMKTIQKSSRVLSL